jgi:hypothetical protein
MPGCALHLELARRVLSAWAERPEGRPFPPDDPSCRRAFLFGGLAPDLGYFPGGDSLLADLAHCVHPAHLARVLLRSAEPGPERALAWGWATHVLGDVWIHPLINEAVAERLHGHRVPSVNYAADPLTHVRVELGLDAFLPARAGWPDCPAEAGLHPGPAAVTLLARAYRQTYGLTLSRRRLRFANRVATALVPILLSAGRVESGRLVCPIVRLAYRRAAGSARTILPGGRLEAFTNPFPPPDWLLGEAGDVVERFVERFCPYYESNLADLPDTNLDTGEVEGDPPDYPLTVAALAELERRTAKSGSSRDPG